MAGPYWGVDSAAPVTTKIHVAGAKPVTLFDFVVDKLKRVPDFWGRYVGGRHQITAEEANYIFTRSNGSCRILVVYNGAHDSANSVRGNFDAGVRDATKAVTAAAGVGVPSGVMLWGDVEGAWQPSADWFLGWWDGMYKSAYAGMGGIYCRPNIPQFYNPYFEALKKSVPKTQIDHLLDPFARKPKDQVVTVVLPDPPFRVRLLWGTRPQKGSWSNPSTDAFAFAPAEPPPLPGRVALWQYRIDFLKRSSADKYGLVDMDLADQRAYDLMWRGKSGAATTGV
jgi:hypothetical protein